MVASDTKDLMVEKADRIAGEILKSDAAWRYWQAREKMQKNERAQSLFDELKRKKNTALILEERLDASHPKMMLAELAVRDIEEKLNEIPVAIQYQEAKDELNEMVQGVVQLILSRLSSEIPVEMGPRQGCGKGHDGNGCSCGNH
jgi:cell fate (sporulation/competence/biofilm development) regulator YmcA (YheA/YmcA/DUF963 family)